MSKVAARDATQCVRASPFTARGIPALREQQSVKARAWDVLCKRRRDRGESCEPASESAFGLGLGARSTSVYFPEPGYSYPGGSSNSGGVGALEKLNNATQVGVKRGVHKQVTSK